MTTPAVSVLMPVYNNGQYLREALDSILNQTFTDFEVLLYNDGSTDNTKEILDSYNDNRLRIINSAENKGLIYWLNEGLANARGKYIARMDGDDISLPERFEKQFKLMEENPEVGICGTQLEIIGTGQKILRPTTDNELRWWIFRGTPFAHPSVMMRTSVLREHNLQYDYEAYVAEDFDLWWRMAYYCRMANLNDVLLNYRIHKNQESNTKLDLQSTNHIQSLKRFMDALKMHPSSYSPEASRCFFNRKMESNPFNLEWAYRFFHVLENSTASANFFGLAEIRLKKQLMMVPLINYLVSYDKRLVKLVRDKEFRQLLKVSRANSYTWVIKSLLSWKTRVINGC